MPAVRRTPFMELFWRVHRSVFRASGGRIGTRVGPLPVLLLSVRGRKSGIARDVLLNHTRDGSRYVVFASHAGEVREPPWWLNLRDVGEGEVMLAGETRWCVHGVREADRAPYRRRRTGAALGLPS